MRTVDAHMHLIDISSHDWYPGLKVWAESIPFPSLYSDFSLADYRRTAGALQVDAFVHVSATTLPRAYLDEARWVDELATREGLDLAIIGTIDPSLEPAEIVADLEQQASSERFRGVRVLYDFVPGSAAADTTLGWLAERDLVFDLVTNPDALPQWLAELAKRPQLRFALEHTGWPTGVDEDARARWDAAMREFAETTDAPCKLSGLGMTTMDSSSATLAPWLERAVELLGWDRVMFGSNMPIETMAGSFEQQLETFRLLVAQAPEPEQAKFWGGNAAAFYEV